MVINTKCFGQVDIEESKIINFENGIMGFEDYKDYTILFDINDGEKSTISWLQSMQEPTLALPIINPFLVNKEYNPVVEDEILEKLGEMTDDNTLVFSILTVPSNIKAMTANLRAPIVINADTRKACQIILENNEYPIRYNVYEAISELKKKEKGE